VELARAVDTAENVMKKHLRALRREPPRTVDHGL